MVKRLLKWIGILFLVLVVLALVLPYFFKDEIVQMIEDEVESTLDAELELGSIDLSFISTFPDFVLEMENTSLIGVGEFEELVLFRTNRLEAVLDLNSVLFGDSYVIKEINLIEPEINVLVNEAGRANYDIYIDTTATPDAQIEETESAPFKLGLQHYSIQNGTLSYVDSTMLFGLHLKNLDHTGSGDFTLEELVLSTKTKSSAATVNYDGIEYMSEVKADIDCDIKMNLSEMRFEFQENTVKLNDFELGFDGWFEMADEHYDMDISMEAENSNFKSLLSLVPGAYSPDFGEIRTDGTIGFSGRVYDKYSDNSMPGFGLNLNVNNAFFQYPELPGKVEKIDVDVRVEREPGADLDNLVVAIGKAHAEWTENFIDLTLLLTKPMSDPNFRSSIRSHIDLSSLEGIVPMEEGDSYGGVIKTDLNFKGAMSDVMEENFESVEVSGEAGLNALVYGTASLPYQVRVDQALLRFDPASIALDEFNATLGRSDMAMSGRITNYLPYVFRDEPLMGKLTFNSKFLDLDELMGIEESAAAPDSTEYAGTADQEEEVSEEVVALPDNVNFTLAAEVNEMRYDSMSIEAISGKVVIANSVATLEDLGMQLLGGGLIMNGTYSTKDPKHPTASFGFDMMNMDINKTARYVNTVDKLMPIAKNCTGSFSSKMGFNSELDQNWMPVMSTLIGDGNFSTKKVFVEGFEPLNKLAEAVKIDRLSKQTINNVKCFFKIVDGKVYVEPFEVNMGSINAQISGNTSLEQEIDYDLKLNIPRSELGSQANAFVDGLLSQAADQGVDLELGEEIPVDVKMTGTVLDPKISTNMKGQGKGVVDEVKEQVVDKINEEIENVDEQLQAKVDQIMSDANAKADQLRAEAKKQADVVRKEGKNAAKLTREEGEKQSQKLLDEARKKGPIAVKLAKPGADKIIKEANTQASNIESEANKKADGIEAEADKQADKIMAEAQQEADKIKLEKRVGN